MAESLVHLMALPLVHAYPLASLEFAAAGLWDIEFEWYDDGRNDPEVAGAYASHLWFEFTGHGHGGLDHTELYGDLQWNTNFTPGWNMHSVYGGDSLHQQVELDSSSRTVGWHKVRLHLDATTTTGYIDDVQVWSYARYAHTLPHDHACDKVLITWECGDDSDTLDYPMIETWIRFLKLNGVEQDLSTATYVTAEGGSYDFNGPVTNHFLILKKPPSAPAWSGIFADDFNRADGNPGANWYALWFTPTEFRIASNKLALYRDFEDILVPNISEALYSENLKLSFTYSTTDYFLVHIKHVQASGDPADCTYYSIAFAPSGTPGRPYLLIDDHFAMYAQSNMFTQMTDVALGDTIDIQVEGTSLTIFVNGSPVYVNANALARLTGVVGIHGVTSGTVIDDFVLASHV